MGRTVLTGLPFGCSRHLRMSDANLPVLQRLRADQTRGTRLVTAGRLRKRREIKNKFKKRADETSDAWLFALTVMM